MRGAIRAPAVAGRFYPGDPEELRGRVRAFLGDTSAAAPVLGLVAPHAGYVYSGGIAGRTFARARVPSRVVVLCPNHTGLGSPVSLVDAGAFRLPGGDVPVDAELAARILAEVPGARVDARAHAHEHAIEVELPFLRERRAELRVVPIVLASLDDEQAVAVGRGLARAIGDEDVLVVASSDMSHYLPDEVTRRKDDLAIRQMLALDPVGLYRTVEKHDISMCGYLPATAMLACARARGASRAELAGYATSGEAFGEYDRVVGYAGVLVS
jgi:AmmeMemoRadiSam system protein B